MVHTYDIFYSLFVCYCDSNIQMVFFAVIKHYTKIHVLK